MNNREYRKKIAQDTLKIIEIGYFQTPNGERINIAELQRKAELGTKVYCPEASDEILRTGHYQQVEDTTEIQVTNQTTLDAVRFLIKQGYEDVLCLNFASAKNP